ncbi:MAG: hypothetical protein U0R78_16910 [Nocardioidaceae bacterium]
MLVRCARGGVHHPPTGDHVLLAQAVGPDARDLVPACGGMLPSLLPPTEPTTATLTGPGMVAGHLLAAVVAAWWLRQGERVVQALGSWVLSRCRVSVRPGLPVAARWRPAVPIAVRRLRSALTVATPTGRAPPRVA